MKWCGKKKVRIKVNSPCVKAPLGHLKEEMKVFVISPLFPDVQLELGESDIQRGITFKELWSRMDSMGEYRLNDLEVEKCDLESSKTNSFQLSIPLSTVITASSVLSLDLRETKIHIHYRAEPITNFNKYGSIRISLSAGNTALDFMKYILRRHYLLLEDSRVDLENIKYEDLILKAAYKDANPHYFLLSDYWMRYLDQEGLVRIEIVHSLKIPEDSFRSIIAGGRLLNSSTHLRSILNLDIDTQKFEVLLDDKVCTEDLHFTDFFSLYHKAKKCHLNINRLNIVSWPRQTRKQYMSKAAKLIRSEKWKDFFNQMKERLEQYASVQIVWPHKTGKTQMAYNLCHYYKVIYVDCNRQGPLLRLITDYLNIQRFKKTKETKSRVYSALWNETGTVPDIINEKDISVGIFESILQYWDGSENIPENGFENLKKMPLKLKEISPMSIVEFKAKYPTEALSKYLIFMDNDKNSRYDNTTGPLRLLIAILGFKLVTTGETKLRLDLPPEGIEIKKWCSIVRLPITFVREISDIPFDEELLLNRLSYSVSGNDATKKRFVTFMLGQIDNSFAGAGQFLLKYFVESLDFKLKEGELVNFEAWRDSLVQKIIKEMHGKYGFFLTAAVDTLFNPWNSEPQSHYFSLLLDESSMSGLSSAQFVDFDVQEDYFNAQGEGERRFTQGKVVTPSDLIPWDTNVFQYIYLFSVVSQKVVYVRMLETERRITSWRRCKDLTSVAPNFMIAFSHESLKHGLIRRTLLFHVLRSYILGFTENELEPYFKLNIPSTLTKLISSIEVAFLGPYSYRWDPILHEVYPKILGIIDRRDDSSYYFDYHQRGRVKKGIVTTVLGEKSAFSGLLAKFKKDSSKLLIIIMNRHFMLDCKGWKESCTELSYKSDEHLTALKERLDALREAGEDVVIERIVLEKQIKEIQQVIAPLYRENHLNRNEFSSINFSGLNVFMLRMTTKEECTFFEVNSVPNSTKLVIILPLIRTASV